MTRFLIPIVSLFLSSSSLVAAYNNNNKNVVSRRDWMNGLVVGAATTAGVASQAQPANAVISSKFCAYGTGDGCDDLAEGNEYIRQLQAKSAANKETIQMEARNAYYMKNYPDFFAALGKSMIKKPDGSFMVVDDVELQTLKNQNKIGLEYATAMGGKFPDLTQKPIMTLRE